VILRKAKDLYNFSSAGKMHRFFASLRMKIEILGWKLQNLMRSLGG
jgi:hypothetical protein